MDNALYFAVAGIVLPVIVGVLMGLYPEHRVFGWAVIAICAAMFFASTAFYLADRYPAHFDLRGARNYFIGFAAGTGLLVVLCAMLFFDQSAYRKPATISPTAIRTGIRLQFFGDTRIPQPIDSNNIASWFAYFSPSLSFEFKDKDGKTLDGGTHIPPNWVIYLTLDKPASFKQVVVDFSNPSEMPIIDTQQQNSRAIMVSTRGLMPAGVLDIHVIQ
jgi:hypothetical protein